MLPPTMTQTTRQRLFAAWFAYAAAVLALDCLALRLDIDALQWRFGASFDAFKFVLWFAVPFALCVPYMDWRYFSPRNFRVIDLAILLGLCLLGALAVGIVAVFPDLRLYYPSYASLPLEGKLRFLSIQLAWMTSWLLGWEFLMRYVLVRHVLEGWPARGALAACALIPIIETAYHVGQGKHWLECAGVLGYSLMPAAWAVWRRSALWPFLAHLFIEVFLVAFLLLV